jgi:hypothetical protein
MKNTILFSLPFVDSIVSVEKNECKRHRLAVCNREKSFRSVEKVPLSRVWREKVCGSRLFR